MNLPLIFLVYFLAIAFLSRFYIEIAKRLKIIDVPNERSSHDKAVIRGGGILFYLGFLIFSIHSGFEHLYLFIGVTLLASVSFWDDIESLSAKQRLPIQAISIALLAIEMENPLSLILFPLFIIAGVLAINCYNFIDGINGMLGFYSLSVFTFFGYMAFAEGFFELELFLLIVFSIVVFGYYNFRRKALFFSGDVGSMTLGILTFFSLSVAVLHLKSPILLLSVSVYLTDTVGTIFKRILGKENILEAHREHIYEQLADKGLNHMHISAGYAALQLLLNVIALMLYKSNIEIQVIILLVVQAALVTSYLLLNKKLASAP